MTTLASAMAVTVGGGSQGKDISAFSNVPGSGAISDRDLNPSLTLCSSASPAAQVPPSKTLSIASSTSSSITGGDNASSSQQPFQCSSLYSSERLSLSLTRVGGSRCSSTCSRVKAIHRTSILRSHSKPRRLETSSGMPRPDGSWSTR
jgi:hypothetical protein